MKKIILLITVLLLTGCFGEAGKGYITKKCTKQESINGNIVNTSIEIKSKQGNIENIEITELYDKNIDLESITKSKKSEQNLYKQMNGISLDILGNEFKYIINVQEIPEIITEKFNIKNEQHKQIKYYEELGYECK